MRRRIGQRGVRFPVFGVLIGIIDHARQSVVPAPLQLNFHALRGHVVHVPIRPTVIAERHLRNQPVNRIIIARNQPFHGIGKLLFPNRFPRFDAFGIERRTSNVFRIVIFIHIRGAKSRAVNAFERGCGEGVANQREARIRRAAETAVPIVPDARVDN